MDDTAQRINEKLCKTAGEFNALVDEFAGQFVPDQVTLFQKRIALEALRKIVLRTPVDTGRARGNWQTTIGAAPESESLQADPIQAGVNAIHQLGAFSIVFVSNNVPYIIYLEDGTSQQAPAGMVQLTLEELKAMIAP